MIWHLSACPVNEVPISEDYHSSRPFISVGGSGLFGPLTLNWTKTWCLCAQTNTWEESPVEAIQYVDPSCDTCDTGIRFHVIRILLLSFVLVTTAISFLMLLYVWSPAIWWALSACSSVTQRRTGMFLVLMWLETRRMKAERVKQRSKVNQDCDVGKLGDHRKGLEMLKYVTELLTGVTLHMTFDPSMI